MKSSSIGLVILSVAVVSPAFAEVDTNSEAYKKAYKETYDKAYAERLAENRAKTGATADSKKSESAELIVPTQSSADWFVQGGGSYLRHVSDGVGTNLYGAEIATGVNFAKTDLGFWTAQVSTGYLKSKEEAIFTGVNSPTELVEAIPLLFSANYNFAITKSGNSTFFVGLFGGGYFVKDTVKSGSTKISANDTTASAGVNLGFNLNVVERCDLVLAFSAGKIGAIDLDYGNGLSGTIEAGEVYALRAGVRFRF